VHEEDEEFEYLMIRIAGEISWDFKPNHFQKIQEKMEEYCPWEDVAMGLRLTLRENYLWKKGDFSGYKSGMGVPESEQTIDNLPFILDLMPKSWCIISHRDPKENHFQRQILVTVQPLILFRLAQRLRNFVTRASTPCDALIPEVIFQSFKIGTTGNGSSLRSRVLIRGQGLPKSVR
jgi:hypothetical protein